MSERLLTITGANHYYGQKPFEIGRILKLQKDHENEYDGEAIKVVLPFIGTVGYVANSTYTTYIGTNSAGHIYDKFEEYAFAKVLVITHTSIIVAFLDKDNDEIKNMYNSMNEKCFIEKEKSDNDLRKWL